MLDALTADVFVIGGGPAGLAAALSARAAGFTVAVADLATPPFDKACGEGLMPDAIAALARLGVHVGPEDGAAFDGVRFTDGHRAVEAKFPSGIGVGIRRPMLHRILVEHAINAGVLLQWGARVERTCAGEIVMNGSKVQARWIIGADGHKSRVRRWAGLRRRQQHVRFGFRQHYRVKPWTSCVEVHWGTDCQIVVTPVGSREVSLALLTGRAGFRVADALPQFPDLLLRLKGAEPSTVEKGTLTSMTSVDPITRGSRRRFALIGDSSGSVDAITGEGLRLAFQQAVSLGRALAANNLASYQEEHRRIARLPTWMSRLMLLMDQSAPIRYSAMRAFAACPQLFGKLLAIHTGAPVPLVHFPERAENLAGLFTAENVFPKSNKRGVVRDPR